MSLGVKNQGLAGGWLMVGRGSRYPMDEEERLPLLLVGVFVATENAMCEV